MTKAILLQNLEFDIKEYIKVTSFDIIYNNLKLSPIYEYLKCVFNYVF